MKIKNVLYKAPEMSEDRLLKIISNHIMFLDKCLIRRIESLHKEQSIEQAILKEWDLIQEKNSYLTKGERDKVCSLVSVSLIEMTKYDEQVEKKA